MIDSLSTRGRTWVRDMSPLMHAHYSVEHIKYDPDIRPDGYINMGTAETHLINEEVIELLTKISNRMEIQPKHLHYDYFFGSNEFRTAIAKHWQHLVFGENSSRKITLDNISIGSGCSLALEMIATMMGDAGDAVLVPAPYYSGFGDDFTDRAGVELIPVPCGQDLNKEAFEKVYKEHANRKGKIFGVLFSSPNNPVGTVYKAEEIQNIISFCMEHNLEIISDEIYAETIHDPTAKHVSTLSLVPDEYLEHTHVTSSFAKDFALSGFRTGFVISYNMDLLKGMHNLSYYSGVSTHTQALLTELLSAPELPDMLDLNRRELHKGYLKICDALANIGAEVYPAQGGIFVFADFSKFLEEQTFEAEMALWEKIYKGLRVNISPGKIFAADRPGWFRVCYAHTPAVVDEACRRLQQLKEGHGELKL